MCEYVKTEIQELRGEIITQQNKWKQRYNHMSDATVETSTHWKQIYVNEGQISVYWIM